MLIIVSRNSTLLKVPLFCFQQLEKFLPERPVVMEMPEDDGVSIEECHLTEFDPTEQQRQKEYNAHDSDDEDDGMHGHGGGGPGVQCATQ